MRGSRLAWSALVLVATAVASGCGGGSHVMPNPFPSQTPVSQFIVKISSDPFTNATSQHATQVEPSIAVAGMMLVAAFQSGRFSVAGSSDIGFATSLNGGMTWVAGFLPGTTAFSQPAGPFDSVSDPAVAYDAAHATWLIVSLPIFFSNAATPAALISRSTDGLTWSNPVSVAPGQASTDKTWVACDDRPGSPFYGHCYVEWDDPNTGIIHMNTSTDGGMTWGATLNTLNNATGLGGQPVVQSNGTVIVPIDDATESNVLAFRSLNGGASWTSSTPVAAIVDHFEAANLRSGPLPSAAIDASGKVYLVWQDCRYRTGCSANDIVMSTSPDGVSWTAPARVPIDPIASTVDHFIPGVGVDPATSGAGAHLGLTYYYYSNTSCTSNTCQLFVGFTGSQDSGTTWSAPVTLAGPMSVGWLASTTQGPMVGDYIATAFSGGHPFGIFAVANPPADVFLDEAMYAPKFGALALRAGVLRSSPREHPIPGIVADHGPRPRPPIR